MTQKDGSPEASEGPYWSEELLAVLVVGLGDETQARETLEGIIQQALSGRALQGISEEALASYLSKLYERIDCGKRSRLWCCTAAQLDKEGRGGHGSGAQGGRGSVHRARGDTCGKGGAECRCTRQT